MTTYGWYYDGETINDYGGDQCALIELAVQTAVNDGRSVRDVRVGPMVDADVKRLINQDDIEEIYQNLGTHERCFKDFARAIVEYVSNRHADDVTDGRRESIAVASGRSSE